MNLRSKGQISKKVGIVGVCAYALCADGCYTACRIGCATNCAETCAITCNFNCAIGCGGGPGLASLA